MTNTLQTRFSIRALLALVAAVCCAAGWFRYDELRDRQTLRENERIRLILEIERLGGYVRVEKKLGVTRVRLPDLEKIDPVRLAIFPNIQHVLFVSDDYMEGEVELRLAVTPDTLSSVRTRIRKNILEAAEQAEADLRESEARQQQMVAEIERLGGHVTIRPELGVTAVGLPSDLSLIDFFDLAVFPNLRRLTYRVEGEEGSEMSFAVDPHRLTMLETAIKRRIDASVSSQTSNDARLSSQASN